MKLNYRFVLTFFGFTLVLGSALGGDFQAANPDDKGVIHLASGDAGRNQTDEFRKHFRPDVAPVDNAQYEQECGTCHFAYQPGLLPESAWRNIMANLDNHFGENAELSKDAEATLVEYLSKNAADYSSYRLSQRIMRSLKGHVPERIMDVRFIRHEHNEIPKRIFKQNPNLRLSDCQACHRDAKTGSYNEHGVVIPGVGKWDD